MENLTLLEAVLFIVFLVIAGVVVKIGVTFDINAWLKLRSEHRGERLKILCTHTDIVQSSDGGIEVKTLFHSPSGTLIWICSRCQLITSDRRVPKERMEFFAKNPKAFFEREKKFNKVANKMYNL